MTEGVKPTAKELQQWAEIRDTMADDLLNAEQKKTFVLSILRGSLANPPPAPQGGKEGEDDFDFWNHLVRQRVWSEKTFGPGQRTKGVCDHIRKELLEIEAAPGDLEEWIDVVILALDGAWRSSHNAEPSAIIDAIEAKQTKNESRKWPDWRTMDPEKAIEHVRATDPPPAVPAPQVVDSQEANRARLAEIMRVGRVAGEIAGTSESVAWIMRNDDEYKIEEAAKHLDRIAALAKSVYKPTHSPGIGNMVEAPQAEAGEAEGE